MRKIACTSGLVAAILALGVTTPAEAQRLPSPNATKLFGADVVEGNNSNLWKQTSFALGDFWVAGACPDGSGSYEKCDDLRFGLSFFPKRDANGNGCSAWLDQAVLPQEDGGDLVESTLGNLGNGNNAYRTCGNSALRPLGHALKSHRELSFPELAEAPLVTKEAWFEQPHLTLLFVEDLPQLADNNHGNQVRESLLEACTLFRGVKQNVPSMPTWVMLARNHSDPAVPYGELLAAAGGTGTCCYGSGCTIPASHIQAHDEICEHVEKSTEAELREYIADKAYTCTPHASAFSTGSLDFSDSNNSAVPAITCHLYGKPANGNSDCSQLGNNGFPDTNLYGIFSCIRSVPLSVQREAFSIRFCDSSGECTVLKKSDLEFIDENETLFILPGDYCDGNSAEIYLCPNEGEACNTGYYGRCSAGQIACDSDGNEYCERLFDPMPEICNGLDNDCDGQVGNMSFRNSSHMPPGTAHSLPSLPANARALSCHGRDVCLCPNGPETDYVGEDLQSYVASWSGQCYCETGLSDGAQEWSGPVESHDAQVACTAMPTSEQGALGGAALFFLAMAGAFGWRRRRS